MIQQKKGNKLLDISISFSIISIISTLIINAKIANNYNNASGKTQALFGLQEIFTFGYQYYVAIVGIVAFLLVIFSINKPVSNNKKLIAILLSVIAAAIVFLRIWRLFV